jgi:hypothetical protein
MKRLYLFGETQEDLPLFSGTCPRAKESVFAPQALLAQRLPGLDGPPDWNELAANRDKIIRRKRRKGRSRK